MRPHPTGDIWLFRGGSAADHAIRLLTNAPVNHVGMAVVLDDMPPLMWHAELGKGLLDVWTGSHQRGVQLHDLRAAVVQWTGRYGQQAWLRQLDVTVTRDMEDDAAADHRAARRDAVPSTAKLIGRVARGGHAGSPAPSSTTAPRSSPRRTPPWACSATDRPTNYYDPGSSGPATTSSCCAARGSARRSAS